MAQAVFGYWDTRGLAEPVRLMLEYCDIPYEDKRYVCGDAPDYDCSCWNDVKFDLGLEFPNLPYYISQDTKITESSAILKHIARQNKCLMPTSDVESIRCDMFEGIALDLRRDFANLCYRPEPDFETNKETFLEQILPNKLQHLERYLTNKKWLAGDTLTYVDFIFSELLDQIQAMEQKYFERYKKVENYWKKFFKLQKIKAYRNSDRFREFPINNKTAYWG